MVCWAHGAIADTQGAVGSVTGSTAWAQSGETDKEAGVQAMKAASANRDPQTDGYGKVEEVAGKVTGCEGMVQEGAESRERQV